MMDEVSNERLEEALIDGEEDEEQEYLDCNEIEDDLFMEVSEFLQLDLPKQRTYFYPLIKSDTIGFITANAGAGKTWIALSLLHSMSTGRSLFPGWSVNESVPVGFLDGEMPANVLKERLCCFDWKGLKEPFHVLSNGYYNRSDYNLFNECYLDQIKKECLEKKIKILVVDNLVSLTGGLMDENSVEGYSPINQTFLDLRNNGISVIVIHHHGKNGHYRGSSHLIDNIDWHVEINRKGEWLHVNMKKWRYKMVDELKGCKFKMEFDDDGKIRWIGGDKKSLTNTEIIVLKYLKEGMKQKKIAEKIGKSESAVSKIKKKFVLDGYLQKDGQLSELGEFDKTA